MKRQDIFKLSEACVKSVAKMFIFALFSGLFSMLSATDVSAKGGCPTVSEMAENLNEKTREYCGPSKIEWDLADFVPDGIVCDSRQQGLNLIIRVFQDLCEGKIDGDDITKKISRIKVTAHLGTETEYKLLGKNLVAKVPIKEAPVLTKWNDELAKLKTFLRSSTGLALRSNEERENLKAEAETAAENSKREKNRKKMELEQEAKTTLREKNIASAKAKLELAVATYQKKAKEIWSRQDSTPEGMEKKQQEAALALQELNQAQADFQKEISGLK